MDWQDDLSTKSTDPSASFRSTNVKDLNSQEISSRSDPPKYTYGRKSKLFETKLSIKEENSENYFLNQLHIKFENSPYAPRKIQLGNFYKAPSPFKSPDRKEPTFVIFSTPVAVKKTKEKKLAV